MLIALTKGSVREEEAPPVAKNLANKLIFLVHTSVCIIITAVHEQYQAILGQHRVERYFSARCSDLVLIQSGVIQRRVSLHGAKQCFCAVSLIYQPVQLVEHQRIKFLCSVCRISCLKQCHFM